MNGIQVDLLQLKLPLFVRTLYFTDKSPGSEIAYESCGLLLVRLVGVLVGEFVIVAVGVLVGVLVGIGVDEAIISLTILVSGSSPAPISRAITISTARIDTRSNLDAVLRCPILCFSDMNLPLYDVPIIPPV